MNLNAFIRSALLMAAFAAGAALLLWFVYQHATPILAQHQQENLLAQLNTLVPSTAYDNDLAKDKITINNKTLNAKGDITIYRARHNSQPVASLLLVSAPNGYSGDIKLLVAVWADGTLAGVRVLAHKETPGLGDYIEEKRSPWVHQFDGKSLNAPTIERWKVKKDGGVFTYNTGATITPRAIVGTVAKTLSWVRAQGQYIYVPSDRVQGTQP